MRRSVIGTEAVTGIVRVIGDTDNYRPYYRPYYGYYGYRRPYYGYGYGYRPYWRPGITLWFGF